MSRFIKIGNPMRGHMIHDQTRIPQGGRRPGAFLATLLCLFLLPALAARADDVQVTVALADDSADVGESVDYTITVNGATDADVPENISVDGLTITYVGPNTETQIQFGSAFGSGSHIQRSVIHTYSVVPQRPGDFVIPAQQVVVDGKTYTTQQVELKVGGSASSGSGSGGDQGGGRLYYAEIDLPRNTAYIGEAVPIEVRLYLDSRVHGQLMELPELNAEGCTVEKETKPEQSEVTRDGRDYTMVTYKTAVTPATAGNLTVGPITVQAMLQLPQRRPRMHGGPFGDPFFQNQFFDDAFSMMSQPQQVVIRGDPVQLTARPLPSQGQPASFAGAVGAFTMSTSAKPPMVEAGDPITITAKIDGRGNFDRVTAPEITDPDGWKTYPPSSQFQSDDDVGISGEKTFQIAAIAEANKTKSPSLEWSYFDPIQEKYVTLTAGGWPIRIEGQTQQQVAPVGAQQAQQAPAAAASRPDIAYIRADSTGWGRTFEPLYLTRVFWVAQGALLLALLAFVGMGISRKRAADEQARRRDQWHREKDAALAAMQRREVAEIELYQAAARALRLEAAIQTGRAPETFDGSEVLNARALDEETAERVRRIFDRQGEVLYAGAAGGRSSASLQARSEALETVKGYENAKPAA
jgi:hypothetical protein